MDHLFSIPADLSALSVDELQAFIDEARETAAKVAESPSEFISEDRSAAKVLDEMSEGVAAIEAARAELARRESEEGSEEEGDGEEKDEPAAEAEIDADALAALAARADAEPVAEAEAEVEVEEPAAVEPVVEAGTAANASVVFDVKGLATALGPVVQDAVKAGAGAALEAVTAAAKPNGNGLARPARSRSAIPIHVEEPDRIALRAAAENLGFGLGESLPDEESVARMMVDRRKMIGDVPEGTHGDKVPIARAEWGDEYGDDRKLSLSDMGENMEKIEAVVAAARIREAMDERRAEAGGSLVASGGLCAPVTPYYQLQMFSVADRPVRAALASFNADRGGIRFAAPASLADVVSSDAVGIITEAQDAAGGTAGTKTCQVIDCPPFSEVDVSAIYHCLQFGNLGARAFPELVSQWNSLTLAAHARAAETALLDGIRTASTLVTAANTLALGAGAQILSQIITAGAGMRSRHRMDPDAVLRVLLPDWVLEELVSDTYRTQFDRFTMGEDDFVALLRQNDIEPSFYIDGATGRGQVFGAQSAGALLKFPTTMEWYLFPEGSFLYLDGGTLELGLVRDSVLNATNDFQIFGETWENVAFIGVESLAVTTTIDDRGAVVNPVTSAAVSY